MSKAEEAKNYGQEKASQAQGQAKGMMGTAQEKASQFTQGVQDKFGQAQEKIGDAMHQTGQAANKHYENAKDSVCGEGKY